MKKLLKWAKILLAVVIVATAALAIAIKIFVKPEKVTAFIETKASESLNRQVKMDSISLGLFSGLNLTNFHISEKPNFTKGTFVSCDRLHIQILWPLLLSKKIVISQFEMKNPFVSLIRYSDGKTTNISDLTSPPTTNASTKSISPSNSSSPTSSFSLLITQAKLTNGRLDFKDESPSHNSASLSDFNFIVRNFSLLKPIDIETSFKAEAKKIKFLASLTGKASLNGTLSIKNATISSGQSKVSFKGEAHSLLSSNPSMDLDISLTNLDPANFASIVTLPADLHLKGPLTGSVHVKGNLSNASFDSNINMSAMAVSYARQFNKASGIPLTLKSSGELRDNTNLSITNYQLSLGPLIVKGKGSFEHLGDNNAPMTLALETNNFEWGSVSGFIPGMALPAGISFKEPFYIEARVSGNFNAITIDSYKLSLGAARLSGRGRYVRIPHQESLDLIVQGTDIPLEPLGSMIPLMKDYALAGKASIDVRLSGSPTNPKIKSTLALDGGSLRYNKTELSGLKTNADITDDSVSFSELTGLINGQSLKATLKAVHLITHPVITTNVNIVELDLNKLVAEGGGAPGSSASSGSSAPAVPQAPQNKTSSLKPMDLEGSIKIGNIKHTNFSGKSLELKWNLTNLTPDFGKLNGSSSLHVGPGNFSNIQSLVSGSTMARLLLMPVTVLQKINKAAGGKLPIPSFDQVGYQTIVGYYVFKNGVATVSKFSLNGSDVNASMTGTAALSGSQALDLKSTMHLGAATDNVKAVNLVIKGTLMDPQASLDMKATAGQAVDIIKSGAADQLLKKYGLPTFGHPSAPAPAPNSQAAPDQGTQQTAPDQGNVQAAPAQENNSQKTIEDLGNLLKGILKK